MALFMVGIVALGIWMWMTDDSPPSAPGMPALPDSLPSMAADAPSGMGGYLISRRSLDALIEARRLAEHDHLINGQMPAGAGMLDTAAAVIDAADLNRIARHENVLFNRRARDVYGRDAEDRPWLHVDDWVRMRPAIAVLVGIAMADGRQPGSRQFAIIMEWAAWRLANSRWADTYAESKHAALAERISEMQVTPEQCHASIDLCARTLSQRQRRTLITYLQRLSQQAGPIGNLVAQSAAIRIGAA